MKPEDSTKLVRKRYVFLISRYSFRRAIFDVLMDILVAYSILSSFYFLGFYGVPENELFIVD
jgi:hypothetical protein